MIVFALRLLAYPVLGALGAYLLFLALAGNLAYWAALSLPVLLLWILAGFVLAFLRHQGGLPSAYVFGNLGLVAGSLLAVLVGITAYVLNRELLSSFPFQIVWLLLVVAGLVGGGMTGPRITPAIGGLVRKNPKQR